MDKKSLRLLMQERRSRCDPALGADLSEHLLQSGLIRPDAVLAGFWPLPAEIDIRPALYAAAGRGVTVALPITPRLGHPLAFRQWQPGVPLREGRFGTSEPDGPPVVPDILLLPLLAFDRAGRRLGYGGGYYDRTLAALPAGTLAIGCAFVAQEVDTVPTQTHDRTMDAIATEAGVFLVE